MPLFVFQRVPPHSQGLVEVVRGGEKGLEVELLVRELVADPASEKSF